MIEKASDGVIEPKVAITQINRLKKVIILVVILLMPGLFFYFLKQKAENTYISLPILGPKAGGSQLLNKSKPSDYIYHKVANFTLLNENAERVSFPKDTHGISIVNFFYIDCEGFCLIVNNKMDRLANIFARHETIRFYSISVDPKDRPERLKEYVNQFNKSGTHWEFLTGEDGEVLKIAKDDFLMNAVLDTTQSGRFIISPLLALIDSEQRIRAYYDGTEPKELERLIDEIKLLVAEERQSRFDKNE